MSGQEHISQEDLALLALQALSPDEAAALRARLSADAEGQEELARLHGDLGLLAMSVEQQALPSGARERFLAKLSAQNAEASKPLEMPRRPDRTVALRFWQAAAAVLVLAVGLLGWRVNQLRTDQARSTAEVATLTRDTAQAKKVLEVLTAPTAQRVVLTAAKAVPEPTGNAVYLADRGALIFQANHLHPVPQGKTYELWVIPANGHAPIPAGLFTPDAAGSARIVLPPLPTGVPAKAFGVTLEQASGSATPTAPILLVGAVAS